MAGRVHVIGAGLSGLSAAVRLRAAGRDVTVWERARHAGGRCRSLNDRNLGREIDNGNHLVLSGNRAVYAYLEEIGAPDDALEGPEKAEFCFLDVSNGERWSVRPTGGRVPWWIFSPRRRVRGTRWRDYLSVLRLARADGAQTVADCVKGDAMLYQRFWEPLAVAALNTHAQEGAASLLWSVVKDTFAQGEAACRPRVARRSLSACFVDPALARLTASGASVRLGVGVKAIRYNGDRVEALQVGDGEALVLEPEDAVVLAVPPAAATDLVPGLVAPRTSRAILNCHFLLPNVHQRPIMLGLISGMSHWLFVRGDVASVTVSAADEWMDVPPDRLARRIWFEVTAALGMGPAPLARYRIIKERRATFAQTPAELARRPRPQTQWRNMMLAGDWTDTRLPATIEGSLQSGHNAATILLAGAATP